MESQSSSGEQPRYRETETNAWVLKTWRRIPLLIRAPALGVAIMLIGVEIWRTLARINIGVLPEVPWASAAMLVFLALYWFYLSGRFWPKATAETRRLSMRAHTVMPLARSWTVAAGLVGLAFTISIHFLSLRFIDLPPETFSLVPHGLDLPWQTLWGLVIMIPVVAGVCEEIGVRGYVQTPLETRYGVIVAVLVSSVVFMLIHFNRELGVAMAAPLFLAALWYGALTAAANSILPMIVIHIALDVALIGYHDLLNGAMPAPFSQTGYSDDFVLNAAAAGVLAPVLAALIFIVALKTRRAWRKDGQG